MIYRLPTVHSRQDGYDHLAELARETASLANSRLELDFSQIGFFDANMAAPLGAILARVADRFNAIEVVSVPDMVERVLRKNGFLTLYRYPTLDDENRTTIPFRRLQRSDEGLFSDYVQRHLRGKGIPQMTEGLGKVFKKKIFEVFQNAVIHSESELGIFVCGQFFPQKQRLDLTIVDAGIGIRESVRRFLGNKISSVDAIRWALQEGHTTKMGPQPGGLGLKFLHDFVRLNKGQIQIASRFGFYEFRNNQETFTKIAADFPGTAVTIEINTADTASYALAAEIQPGSIF
ncbi:MAG: sensor histidine kinase [Elusimicrobia bacterium]|nr:sensor histidine kinase [Elusimicrobiota bacterium]